MVCGVQQRLNKKCQGYANRRRLWRLLRRLCDCGGCGGSGGADAIRTSPAAPTRASRISGDSASCTRDVSAPRLNGSAAHSCLGLGSACHWQLGVPSIASVMPNGPCSGRDVLARALVAAGHLTTVLVWHRIAAAARLRAEISGSTTRQGSESGWSGCGPRS
jgi:hypothetical protein